MSQPAKNPPSFTRRDVVTIVVSVLVVLFGLASLACGGGNQSARDDEAEPETARAPATQEEPTLVEFAVAEAELQMGLPMARYVQQIGPRGVATPGVISGDWFVENFAYQRNGLTTVTNRDLTEDVVIALRHRRLDATILVWARPEDFRDAERTLDTVADGLIGRVLDAEALTGLLATQSEPRDWTSAALEGVVFANASLGGRAALRVDVHRVAPTSRVRQQLRLVLTRQFGQRDQYLIGAAMLARRDDFEALTTDFEALVANVVLTGQPIDVSLNPNRELGPASDEYAYDRANLESAPPALQAGRAGRAGAEGGAMGVPAAEPLPETPLPETPLPPANGDKTTPDGQDAPAPTGAPAEPAGEDPRGI